MKRTASGLGIATILLLSVGAASQLASGLLSPSSLMLRGSFPRMGGVDGPVGGGRGSGSVSGTLSTAILVR